VSSFADLETTLAAMPLYLTEQNVASLLEPADAVPIIEESFRRLAAGEVVNQPRLRLPLDGGALALMGAVDGGLGLAGVKTYSAVAGNAAFVVVLFDAENGQCVGVIEANILGQLRTGAASAVAAKHLARDGARRLGIIGCGFQAETQVACIRAALPTLEHVTAYCRTEAKLADFCARVGAEPAETHREAVGDVDVVVTATTSKDPVLRGEWVRAGALICAVGANHPSRRELDDVVLERASFVCCDSREQARRESGDLIEPVANGVLDWLEVYELQDVVAGEVRGREAADDIVVFKSNGLAAWDVAIGAAALQRARERGVGASV
jgi:ornithine cyclodeaminase/alanine dehydrogenase-like protein (mu-crystallin family)